MRLRTLFVLTLLALVVAPLVPRDSLFPLLPAPESAPAAATSSPWYPEPLPTDATPAPGVTSEEAIALVLATERARQTLAPHPSYQPQITESVDAYHELQWVPAEPEKDELYPSFRVDRVDRRVLFPSQCQEQSWRDERWLAFEEDALARIINLPEVQGYMSMLFVRSQGEVPMTMFVPDCSPAGQDSAVDRIEVYVGEHHPGHTVRGFSFQIKDRSRPALFVRDDSADEIFVPYERWRKSKEAATYRSYSSRASGKRTPRSP